MFSVADLDQLDPGVARLLRLRVAIAEGQTPTEEALRAAGADTPQDWAYTLTQLAHSEAALEAAEGEALSVLARACARERRRLVALCVVQQALLARAGALFDALHAASERARGNRPN